MLFIFHAHSTRCLPIPPPCCKVSVLTPQHPCLGPQGGSNAMLSEGEDGEEGSSMVPEDIGRRAAHALLDEVARGGVVDSGHQGLVLLLCALGPEEINEVRLGPLTPYAGGAPGAGRCGRSWTGDERAGRE